jgi:hypothetical protein
MQTDYKSQVLEALAAVPGDDLRERVAEVLTCYHEANQALPVLMNEPTIMGKADLRLALRNKIVEDRSGEIYLLQYFIKGVKG